MEKGSKVCGNGEQSVFFFIPDISGYTNFIRQVDLKKGAAFIQELLESIIQSNISQLQISEIQGDAILFYRFGKPLNLKLLRKQCQQTFTDFHKTLTDLKSRFKFPEAALKNFSLKFVVHYGKVGTAYINGDCKMIGVDMVIANKILKNNIDGYEYVLMTDNYLKTQDCDMRLLDTEFGPEEIYAGSCWYEDMGLLHYKYLVLDSSALLVNK